MYRHDLTCDDINSGEKVNINIYSTKKEEFTVDYIKANSNLLLGLISTVVDINGVDQYDRRIGDVLVVSIPPEADFVIASSGTTPTPRSLKFDSDIVIEV